MTPTINLNEEVYSDLGRFGNRDESWNTVVKRLLEHVDEEAAIEDRDNRESPSGYEPSRMQDSESGDPTLRQLDDGTVVRHKYQRGSYSGAEVEGRIRDGEVEFDGERYAPSTAARIADEKKRGEDSMSTANGWTWWEFQNDDGEWVKLDSLRQEV